MTSPCPVLAGYTLVRFGPYACLSPMYVQNLSVAYAFAVVDLHNLLSIFYYFGTQQRLSGLGVLVDYHWSIYVSLPIARQRKTILFVC